MQKLKDMQLISFAAKQRVSVFCIATSSHMEKNKLQLWSRCLLIFTESTEHLEVD